MPPTGRPAGLQVPAPATVGPLQGTSAAGDGNGDDGLAACLADAAVRGPAAQCVTAEAG